MSEETIRNLVSVGTVGLTAGIDLPNTVIVQGGVDGAFFPANQIGWGTSYFGGQTFTTTTELLSLIDAAIAAGGSDVVKVLEDYVNGLLDKYVKDEELEALDYASKTFVGDANQTLDTNIKAWVGEQNYLQNDDIAHLASTSALEAHTGNGDVHVTAQQKTDWQAAADAIKAFLDDNATSDQVVNTLKELQEYISSHGEVATELLNDVSALKNAGYVTADTLAGYDYASKSSVSSSITEATKDFVTDSELEAAIKGVDVTEQLKDYASASSVSALQGQYTALSAAVTQIDGKVETANANWQAADNVINASISALNTNVATNIGDIAALKASASTYATKAELEPLASKSAVEASVSSLQASISAIATDYVTSQELQDAIDGVDVTEQLKDYATKAELEASESSATATYATKAELEASESSATATYATKAEIEPLASTSALEAHTKDTEIHVTVSDKTNWNDAASAINAFLSDADTTESAIDTLKEIAAWIAADETGTAALVGRVAALEAADETFATKASLSASESSAAATYATKASLSASESSAAATYATKAEAQVSVSSGANSMTINGEKFTFSVSNNVLSVSKYIATTLKSVSLSTINSSKTQTGGGTFYVGTSYTLTAGVDVTSTTQDLTIAVNNTTSNNYKLAVHDGSSYILSESDWKTTTANTVVTINTIMADVANTSISGTVAWGNKTHSATTTGNKTFKVYLTEEGRNYNSSTDYKTVSQSNITASATVKAKVPVLLGTLKASTFIDANGGSHTIYNTVENLTKKMDITYDDRSKAQSFVQEFAAGTVPMLIIPTCLNKTLVAANESGAFQDTSWIKLDPNKTAVALDGTLATGYGEGDSAVATEPQIKGLQNVTVAIGNESCTTSFDVWVPTFNPDTHQCPKPNEGNSKNKLSF